MRRARVLVIAATDSSGGAGLSRDIATLAALGHEAAPAVSAVTVQTHAGVSAVVEIAPGTIAAEIAAAFASGPVDAIKIGMIVGAPAIGAVAGALAAWPDVPCVLDPVVAATSGRVFLDAAALAALVSDLLPLADIVTPNLAELAILTGGVAPNGPDAALDQARCLVAAGARAVLVKGGHGQGPRSTDILLAPGGAPVRLDGPRLPGALRGTGCMLASAIAGHLATGRALVEACCLAKGFVAARLAEAAGAANAAAG